jgi:hypothetical protein
MSMEDDEGFLMGPVLNGMCRMESLLDGTLDLEHIAWANDALAVREENKARQMRAMEDRQRGGGGIPMSPRPRAIP